MLPRAHASTILLVLQEGRVLSLPACSEGRMIDTFLDWTDRGMIEKNFEEGLWVWCFIHPSQLNGLLYVYHTMQTPRDLFLLNCFWSDLSELVIDADYEREMLDKATLLESQLRGPYFGPDGYLYISLVMEVKPMTHKFSQNTFSLLGKVLGLM